MRAESIGIRFARAHFGLSVTCITLVLGASAMVRAHDPNATLTWNREISRIIYARCASCHRPDGTAFSLLTYQDVQPRATAIKDAVLSRRMPPWGAVKGFGAFRNDQALTNEEIELITDWIETGARRGNNPNLLPPPPKFDAAPTEPSSSPKSVVPVSGETTLERPIMLDGLLPERVPDGASMQIVAVRPNGSMVPLVWLYEYRGQYRHPFLLRKPVPLPAGTIIRGVPSKNRVTLLTK